MPSIENLKVLIALLPGFLSQRISHYFGIQYKVSDINTIISALAFTFINFLIAVPIGKLIHVEMTKKDKSINLWFLFILLIVSLTSFCRKMSYLSAIGTKK